MGASFTVVLISGCFLFALTALFRYERTRARRFAKTLRTALDSALEDIMRRTRQKYLGMTMYAARQSAHYIFHQLLAATLHQLRRLEGVVHAVARFNKHRAKRSANAVSPSFFSEIADHKREVQLSEPEKRQKRDEALNGG